MPRTDLPSRRSDRPPRCTAPPDRRTRHRNRRTGQGNRCLHLPARCAHPRFRCENPNFPRTNRPERRGDRPNRCFHPRTRCSEPESRFRKAIRVRAARQMDNATRRAKPVRAAAANQSTRRGAEIDCHRQPAGRGSREAATESTSQPDERRIGQSVAEVAGEAVGHPAGLLTAMATADGPDLQGASPKQTRTPAS